MVGAAGSGSGRRGGHDAGAFQPGIDGRIDPFAGREHLGAQTHLVSAVLG